MIQYTLIYGAGLIGLAVVADCLRKIIRPSSPPPVFNMEL